MTKPSKLFLAICLFMSFISGCSTTSNSNNSNAINTANTTNAPVATTTANTNETNAQGKEIEEPDGTFAGIQLPTSENDKIKINQESILRVEEQVRVFWRGVKSCCERSRITREVESEFARWVEKQKSAHKDLMFLKAHAAKSTITCRSSEGGVFDRESSCSASTTLACYIEFLRPEPEVQYNLGSMVVKHISTGAKLLTCKGEIVTTSVREFRSTNSAS